MNLTIKHERLGREPWTVFPPYHNFAATVTDGTVSHVLTYYMRSEAESALAHYQSLGWTGHVEEIPQ